MHDVPCTPDYALINESPMAYPRTPRNGKYGPLIWNDWRHHNGMTLVDLKTGEKDFFKV